MPRNKSEVPKRCPEAIAYADAFDVWVKSQSLEDSYRVSDAWGAIPFAVRQEVAEALWDAEVYSRKLKAAYIRKHYAP